MTDTGTVLEDLPATAVLVCKTLEHSDVELTQQEIADRTHRQIRSLRRALYRLDEHDLIRSRTICGDARRTVYQSIK